MSYNQKTVVVAMSGGVDSSTTALLLQNQGYKVIGVTALLHDQQNAGEAVDNAFQMTQFLGIEHHVVDLRDQFKKNVIEYFEQSYKNGFTPNPCAVCNRTIKWGELRDYSKNILNAEFYATGHYVRVERNEDGCKLFRSVDPAKDQTYMLFDLTQEALAHTIFPLGNLTKPEVRKIAVYNNLPCAQSKESQDVCFILPPDTTSNYLKRTLGEQEGQIIDINTGKVVGVHSGAYSFTIGQRKGIGVAASAPLYVLSIDSEQNIIYVGFKDSLKKTQVEVKSVNWQQVEFKNTEFKSIVKIRYNTKAKDAVVRPLSNGNTLITLDEPEYGITPGQAAVFYHPQEDYLIGGGWII